MEYVTAVSDYTLQGPILATAVLSVAVMNMESKFSNWFNEAYGSVVMVALTFSPGKWWGAAGTLIEPAMHPVLAQIHDVVPLDWVLHWVGVVAADKSCGGPHVNPGVSLAMFAIGKIPYSQFLTHVGGQMFGGLVAFPLLQFGARELGWAALGGPGVDAAISGAALTEALTHEFLNMFLLCAGIFLIAFEAPSFIKDTYLVKMTCIAGLVRALIVYLGAAGPAINPMLATTWYVYENGALPAFWQHYAVYWGASFAGALTAALAYSVVKPGVAFCAGAAPPAKKGKKSKRE